MSARSWLASWLLHTPVLCVVGLHMPVASLEFDGRDRLVERGRHCAACEKPLPRAREIAL